jgi:hypothetical protein
VPAGTAPAITADTAAEEVAGWTALFASQNYEIAAEKFESCWETTRQANIREMGAFHGLNWAKALYLQSLLGEANARERSLQVLEAAIARGGQSSWFNRMRASLNRARQQVTPAVATVDYADVLVRAFDDLLERVGTTGNRFDRWTQQLTDGLAANHHDQFAEGIERLGILLGYHASRPRHQAATDCRWRGVFGNQKEVITFEVKIEHTGQLAIAPVDVGQAHNQHARAQGEFSAQGYIIRGTIITHMDAIEPAADASAGTIKVVPKVAITNLWDRVRLLLSLYRDRWSVDDMNARAAAAESIRHRIPRTGWLIRALDYDQRFITGQRLTSEWT